MCTGCKHRYSDEAALKDNTASSVTQLHKRQASRCQKSPTATKKDLRSQKEIDAQDLSVIELVPVDHVWTVDVPVPLQAKSKRNHYYASADHYEAGYVVAYAEDELQHFCLEQMEMHGWQCNWQMQGVETLFLFTKKSKQCAISIRPHGKNKQELVVLQQITC
jgi:hypothetical protein